MTNIYLFCSIIFILFVYCCLCRLFFSFGNFLCSNTFFLTLQFCATLGTTSCCSFDKLLELGPICKSLLLLSKIADTSLSHAESFPGHYVVSVSKYNKAIYRWELLFLMFGQAANVHSQTVKRFWGHCLKGFFSGGGGDIFLNTVVKNYSKCLSL